MSIHNKVAKVHNSYTSRINKTYKYRSRKQLEYYNSINLRQSKICSEFQMQNIKCDNNILQFVHKFQSLILIVLCPIFNIKKVIALLPDSRKSLCPIYTNEDLQYERGTS